MKFDSVHSVPTIKSHLIYNFHVLEKNNVFSLKDEIWLINIIMRPVPKVSSPAPENTAKKKPQVQEKRCVDLE